MHGREGYEHRKLSRHMITTTTITGVVDSNGCSDSCFIKDGRKISIGDSALFKPAKDSPPFVGIIRCWTSEKESNLRLRVNWLYRPSEVKLLKGVVLEAAPNEVFYSFHSDEIPAASLLHPCKVAFLPKGVELPPGISSFVCRRVYDITNKCLWWLTDQDYIDDRQDEVDKLLQKTRIEMHASIEHQQDSRSPKPVNGSAASPLKHSPDSVQNSSSNLPSQRKGKKRDRGDQSFDVSKRERSSKLDDVDSGQSTSESTSNFEIAKLSEKGGLVDSESVSRLVRLMQPEKPEKKIDLTTRCMLAGVIAATDKFDCLNQFVQLRGILILNEWLQEVHKGKINDSGNVKLSDKSVDDFLLVLLRALDKLPVNLNALQMCNIGKSVNHLRSHKNSEIQKKARSLVDTWKKRVEAEMSIGETERSQHESSHVGSSRHPSGSDAAIRSPITHHSSLKSSSVKHVPGELNSKSTSSHPVGAKSALSPTSTSDHCKDGQSRFATNGGSSEPQNVAKEEKSSSSSQSHTNSQCSSEQQANKNTIPGGKEDTRRSTAVSKGLTKSVGTTKHRKSTNGPLGVHRETVSIKTSSMGKNSSGIEKSTQSSIDASSILETNNQKIIVKIGNRSRGPAQSVGSSLEDSCRNSEDSSPALSEKHDQSDRGNKNDAQQILEVDGSSLNQNTSETKRLSNVSKIASLSSRTEMKSRKAHDSSFSSMNALIESCAKISEANVSISAGDDVGMNLLASVAAGEISNSSVDHVDRFPDQKQFLGDEVLNAANHIASISKLDKAENVDRSVEGGVKNNGTLVEKVDTSMSASDLGSETVKEKVKPTEESRNELPVASQKDGGSLGPQDKVKNTTCPTNEDEKTNVNQVPQSSDVVLDQSAPVVVQCDPASSIEKSSIVSCGTSKHPGSEKSNEVKSEKTDAAIVETCPPPEKQVKVKCESQKLENKELGGSDLGPTDSHANIETINSHAVEEESKEKSGPATENVVSPCGGQDVDSKLGFDLNEGFDVDEGKNIEPVNLPVSSISSGLPASVTVAAPAKGPFVPPDDLLWNKKEVGWKGSAATSAFRPAEPRKSMEVPSGQTNASFPDAPSRPSRFPLDIDLNVADESCSGPEFTTTSSLRGGLDLDLNKVDEASDMAHMGRHMSSNIQRVEVSNQHASSSTSNLFSNSSASGKRDFDLNDGPAIEDLPVEQTPSIQPNRAHIPFQQPLGPRINSSDIGNCFPWYPPGTSYSLSMAPSALPDREPFSIVGMGGGPQRVMGGPTSALSFNPDAYRGSLLSSSPTMPFHSTPFQYPVLPFGTSFPLPTSALAGGSAGYMDPTMGGRISAIPSQLVGNPASVSFQYPQAYVVSRSLPDVGNTSVVESSHKWGKQGLDLNSGPGVLDVEGRDESLPTMSRQGPTMGSQFNAEEQARMYSMGGGHLKRKEPEGGWNIDKFNFKQSSWR